MKKIRVALLMGGFSNEREISLKSGEEVNKALDPERYQVKKYDLRDDLPKLVAEARDIDVAFIALHGRYGEDGTVQGLLELLRIPYQGSGVLGSALAMNKVMTKALYRLAELPVAKDLVLRKGEGWDVEIVEKELGWPVVIKPSCEGSSIGVHLAWNKKELQELVEKTFFLDREILLEEYLPGREITAGVIGNESLTALPVVEIIPESKYPFFNYEAKYKEKATREICPASLPDHLSAQAQDLAIKAHKALKLRGYSRTDMICSGENLYLLETNTIPGMTKTSLLPLAAKAAGMDFGTLLDRLISLALEDKGSQ